MSTPHNVTHWFLQLGGIGLIPLGLLDSSVVPLPGSMDLVTILLSARDSHLWFYYAAMATAGSVLGGFLTYRLARKGGKEALGKRLPKHRVDKVQKIFERWGFTAIAVPAMLPPPVPMFPFLVVAGGMQYSTTKFLTALTLGRAARYTILALLAAAYGHQFISVFSHHAYTILFVTLGIVVAGVLIFLLLRTQRRKKET